jgi:hypothetical protein
MCRKQPGIAIGRLCEKRVRAAACLGAFTTAISLRSPPRLSPRVLPTRLADDGTCVICDSYVRPCTLVRICDECNYGSYQGRCVVCGGIGISDAYYCKECTQLEKDVRGSVVPIATRAR